MAFYFIKNCYSAQIESAGINFRLGYTCLGIAWPGWHKKESELPWHKKNLISSLGINYHSAQYGRWYRFRIEFGRLQIWFLTKGNLADEYTGFHIAFRGKKEWKLLI